MDHGDAEFIISVNHADQPDTKENSKSEIKNIIIEYSKSTVLHATVLVQLQLQLHPRRLDCYSSLRYFYALAAPRWSRW